MHEEMKYINTDNNHHNNENKTHLDPMSDEQRHIFNHLHSSKDNVIVDACAGSGKSTTILSIAKFMPNKNIIQLTYNSMLRNEIKQKKERLHLNNLSIHTYHSLVVKYYTSDGYTDTVIRRILRNKKTPQIPIPHFDILVIDEAQDMTFLYFKLVLKFCRDMGKPIQLLVLGDFMQGLYEFKGADIRFLTHADFIWRNFELLYTNRFHKCTLKMSYRITQQMANFVNNIMLGEHRLHACREGTSVVYLRRSLYNAQKYVVHNIRKLLSEGSAVPDDFFILGASVKSENSPIRKIENILVENNIPCHVPMFENDKIDERVIEGKIVFSTFHSVKGRQRKYVFIVGFDNSYFNYFARNLSQLHCPNTLYVACTRATHGLYLIELDEVHFHNRPLRFLKMNHIEMKREPYVDFHGLPQTIFYNKKGEVEQSSNAGYRIRNGRKLPVHMTTPTDLIKFIPESILEEIVPILDNIFIKKNETIHEYDIPNIIKTRNGFHEDVSDLNGIAIPMMYFEKLNHYNTFQEFLENMDTPIQNGGKVLRNIIDNFMVDVKDKDHLFLKKIISELPLNCVSISDYLRTSNTYVAVKEKLYFKLKQIDTNEYDWLSESIITDCFYRIHNVLGRECFTPMNNYEIERTIIRNADENLHKRIDDFLCENGFPDELFRFTGRVDLITDLCIWEIKCCSMITNDHLLQVVIYAWLWRMIMEDLENDFENIENFRDFKIFNIKTGEILYLDASMEQLNTIIIALLKGKYSLKYQKEDTDFVSECQSVVYEK
jgi:hypothetical protein